MVVVPRDEPGRLAELPLFHEQAEAMAKTVVPVPALAFHQPAGDAQEPHQLTGRHVVGNGRLAQQILSFGKASLGPQQGDQRMPRLGP